MGALIAELFQRRVALVFDGEERVDEQDEGYRKMMEAAEQEAAMRERARAEQMAALRPAPAPGIPSGPAEPLKPKKPADPGYTARGWPSNLFGIGPIPVRPGPAGKANPFTQPDRRRWECYGLGRGVRI